MIIFLIDLLLALVLFIVTFALTVFVTLFRFNSLSFKELSKDKILSTWNELFLYYKNWSRVKSSAWLLYELLLIL